MDLKLLIFLGLLIYFLILGYFFWKKKNIELFVRSAVLLPLTSSILILHTRFQINVYYVFVVIPLLFFGFRELLRMRISKTTFISCSLLGAFLFLFILLRVPSGFEGISAINLLKDIKPVLFIMIGFVFIDLLKGHRIEWDSKFTYKLIKTNFFVTIFFFLLLNNSSIISEVSDDPFYNLFGMRYLTMGTFFAIFYFISKLALKKKMSLLELLYIITPIFLSGNRTFFIVMFMIYILNMIMSISDVKNFLTKAVLLLGGLLVLVLGILNFNEELKERILSMFDFELVMDQLIEYRLAPFFDKLDNFEFHDYFMGRGIGETFFIPWFTWRKNVDNFNINMDNIYFTLYVKYGVLSLILLLMLYYYIQKANANKRFRILVTTYFLIMGLTTAFMYQYSFLFIVLMLVVFNAPRNVTYGDEVLPP